MAGNAHHGPGAQQVAPMPWVRKWALRLCALFMFVWVLGLGWVIFVAPHLPHKTLERHAAEHVTSTSVAAAQAGGVPATDGTSSAAPTGLHFPAIISAAVIPQGPQTVSYVARDPQKGDDAQPYVYVSIPARDVSGAYNLYDDDSTAEQANYTYRCHVNARGDDQGKWVDGANCAASLTSPDKSVDKFAFVGLVGHSGEIHYHIGH